MFYRAKFQPGDMFIYGIYGIQYQGQNPNSQRLDLIEKFDKLITGQVHLDRITVPGSDEMSTQIWLSYWWPEARAKWWSSPAVGEMEPFGDKIEYWGYVRHRIPDASLGDILASSLEETPTRVPEATTIRPGRFMITELPENICFLVEGQDHSGMSVEEKSL